jgi:hypothetical protein
MVEEFIVAALGVFPVTIYFSILLGFGCAQRQGISIPSSIICVMILCMGCSIMGSLGITLLKNIPATFSYDQILNLGKPGLIVSHSDITVVLLHAPQHPGPHVVAKPDTPLVYQKTPIALAQENLEAPLVFGLPLTPLRNDSFFFLSSFLRDFDSTAAQFNSRFKDGFFPFILYVFSLVFLLCSLRFIMDISAWPLANLFLEMLVFRGVLALGSLLNSQGTLHFFTSFLGDRFPTMLISPVVFYILGVISILYTLRIHLRKNRRLDENY